MIQDARVLFRKWLRDPRSADDPEADGRDAARLLIGSLQALRERIPETSWIVGTLAPPYPNSGDGVGNPASTDAFTRATMNFNGELWRAWEGGTLDVLDLERVGAEWGTRTLFDPRLDQLARFPGSAHGMAVLAERMAARWAATAGRMKKVVALDCDNTLWGGVVGEDGVDGIQMGEDGAGRAFVMFQEALLALEARGVLLTLCSRNNPHDVEEVFARRPEMALRRERLAAVAIGWDSKTAGLQTLARQLGLGLDSFVFVDDNPREREEVRQALPMVTVPEFPDDPADLPALGAELGWRWFQRVRPTQEDGQRTIQYRLRSAAEELNAQAASPVEFLRSLNMTATIHVDNPNLVSRMAQLTQKTNQFNLTLHRYTEAEIRGMLHHPAWHLFAGTLADRFGDHGVVALLIAQDTGRAWKIDVLVQSCRVLGRGYEAAFTTAVIEYLRERKTLPIEARYVPGPRNSQMEAFCPELGFSQEQESTGDRGAYRLAPDKTPVQHRGFIDLRWEVSA